MILLNSSYHTYIGYSRLRCFTTIIFLISALETICQIGGFEEYSFVKLPQSPRATALAGFLSGLHDNDVNIMLSTPAGLNQDMHQKLSINHNFHFAGINHNVVTYSRFISSWGASTGIALSSIQYGDFDRTNEYQQVLGKFSGRETALHLGISKLQNNRLSVGVNLHLINSVLDTYSSWAIAADLGAQYLQKENQSVWSIVIKTVGLTLASDLDRGGLPLDIQLAWSKKLKYLPFTIIVTAHNLHRKDLTFDNGAGSQIVIGGNTNDSNKFANTVDNIFRHLAWGGEFALGSKEQFVLRFGYNHQRNKELSNSVYRSFSGLSAGFGVHLKRFHFDYSIATYHLAGRMNHIGLTLNLAEWGKLF